MKKRNLAAALAVLAISGAVVPMTANAATREPFNVAYDLKTPGEITTAWINYAELDKWASSVNISRNEGESEYAYYLRIRDYVADYWTITTERPSTVARAKELHAGHTIDNEGFYNVLSYVLLGKSDLMYEMDFTNYSKVSADGIGYGGTTPTRYTEMENAYGQKQAIPSVLIHNCDEAHSWWEKDVFGVIRLDGKLYAMKMTTDSATCGTLIPYEELGYKNCDLSWGWDTDMLKARGYQSGTSIPLDKYWRDVAYISVYDADGSYDAITMYKETEQAVVDGVLLYYYKDGKITPMTKALHDTLPMNDTYYYATVHNPNGVSLPAGWKLFAD